MYEFHHNNIIEHSFPFLFVQLKIAEKFPILRDVEKFVVHVDPSILSPPLKGTNGRVGDNNSLIESHVKSIEKEILTNSFVKPIVFQVGLVVKKSFVNDVTNILTKNFNVSTSLKRFLEGI